MNKNNLINDLRNLISIPSYEDESKVVAYIIKQLKKSGFKPKKDKIGNVILEVGKGVGFLLNAHMDTVKPYDDSQLKPYIKNGRLYGRGSSDTKCGIACMLEIARNINKKDLKKKLIFVFSVKEEDSTLENNGAYFSLKSINAKEGLVMEPCLKDKEITFGIGCKGTYRAIITIYGRSCHSSNPNKKINAIYIATRFINEFKKIKLKPKIFKIKGKKHTLCPVATITQINAWEGTNVIPGKCVLTIDYRALPEEKQQDIENKIKRICKKTIDKYDYEAYFMPATFYYNYKCVQLVKQISSKYGYKAVPIIRPGRNDSSIFNEYGKMKTICLGPGDRGQAHTKDESIRLNSFIDTCAIIDEIVRKECY